MRRAHHCVSLHTRHDARPASCCRSHGGTANQCPFNDCATCPTGQYRRGCGTGGVGSCVSCTATADTYFTGDGGQADSCPTSACPRCNIGARPSLSGWLLFRFILLACAVSRAASCGATAVARQSSVVGVTKRAAAEICYLSAVASSFVTQGRRGAHTSCIHPPRRWCDACAAQVSTALDARGTTRAAAPRARTRRREAFSQRARTLASLFASTPPPLAPARRLSAAALLLTPRAAMMTQQASGATMPHNV